MLPKCAFSVQATAAVGNVNATKMLNSLLFTCVTFANVIVLLFRSHVIMIS